jgi:hypothetical protein
MNNHDAAAAAAAAAAVAYKHALYCSNPGTSNTNGAVRPPVGRTIVPGLLSEIAISNLSQNGLSELQQLLLPTFLMCCAAAASPPTPMAALSSLQPTSLATSW